MNASQIVEQVKNRKGQHVLATWERPAKTFKDCPLTILKKTVAWVRAGIDYANLAIVKEGIANGERGEVEEITWADWIQHPFILRHKKTFQEYVRLYPAVFENLRHPQVEWTIDGRVATWEQVEPHLLAEEKKENRNSACFMLKAETLVSIGE